jgi:hypothetical protein
MTERLVPSTVGGLSSASLPLESQDRMLLLVELRAAASEEEAMACMQLVGQAEQRGMGYCNTPTKETCIICDRPVCEEHWSKQRVYVYVHEDEAKNLFRLCQGCAALSREDAHALRALLLKIKRNPAGTFISLVCTSG